ncbi:MAG: magnesium transporter [Caldilineaceae bacterium]
MTALEPQQISTIHDFIQRNEAKELRRFVAGWTPPELANLLEELPPEEDAILFRLLPRKLATETFEFLDTETQQDLISTLAQEQERLVALINGLSPDDRTALLEETPGPVAQQLLNLLSPKERKITDTLLGYPEESIGRLMTPDYVAVRPEWAMPQVLEHIRRVGHDSETLNSLYVVDQRSHLLDDLRIREILLAKPDALVGDLMDHRFVALTATDDQESAVHIFRDVGRVALPVTDSQGVLIGIVTVDDVLDVAAEEAGEDVQKIGGAEVLETPYLTTPFTTLVNKRARWLVVLFLSEMLTATAMSYFQDEIARAVILALFVPLIISSGGNSGSQAATLIIRALALGEVTLGDWWQIMRRELVSGLSLGMILGVIGFARIVIWQQLFGLYGEHWMLIALTVALSLVGVVMWGTLSGSMLPLLLKKLGADPAASSAPFVATLVDVTGLIIYFSVAGLVLRGALL